VYCKARTPLEWIDYLRRNNRHGVYGIFNSGSTLNHIHGNRYYDYNFDFPIVRFGFTTTLAMEFDPLNEKLIIHKQLEDNKEILKLELPENEEFYAFVCLG